MLGRLGPISRIFLSFTQPLLWSNISSSSTTPSFKEIMPLYERRLFCAAKLEKSPDPTKNNSQIMHNRLQQSIKMPPESVTPEAYKDFRMASGHSGREGKDYTLISTSTPQGSSSFIRASTVLAVLL